MPVVHSMNARYSIDGQRRRSAFTTCSVSRDQVRETSRLGSIDVNVTATSGLPIRSDVDRTISSATRPWNLAHAEHRIRPHGTGNSRPVDASRNATPTRGFGHRADAHHAPSSSCPSGPIHTPGSDLCAVVDKGGCAATSDTPLPIPQRLGDKLQSLLASQPLLALQTDPARLAEPARERPTAPQALSEEDAPGLGLGAELATLISV